MSAPPAPPPLPVIPALVSGSPVAFRNEKQTDDEAFEEITRKYRMRCGGNGPVRVQYRNVCPVLQNGPQCGLAALCMAAEALLDAKLAVEDVFAEAVRCGYTKQGEMFSAADLAKLAERLLPCQAKVVDDVAREIDGFISAREVLLVPYDADCDHYPCLNGGRKAHWAVVLGSAGTNPQCVVARHGKSCHVAVWHVDDLVKSNRNLEHIDVKRADPQLYVLPTEGIGETLRNRAILLHRQ